MMETDRLIDDYLRRLEKAAAELPVSRRADLKEEIREHIEEALQEEDSRSEAAVRNVLERLGDPEEIVASAGPGASGEPGRRRPRALEITALLALLVPFIGWLVGMVLVIVSDAWARRDKLIGITLLLVALLVPLFALTLEAGGEDLVPAGDTRPVGEKESGSPDPGYFGLFILLAVPSALYLGWRLRTFSAGARV